MASFTAMLVAVAMAMVSCEAFRVSNSGQNVPLVSFGAIPQQDKDNDLQGPAPSESFPFHDHLADGYTLYWKFNETHITFEAVVKTNGWVGFGISPKGAMAGSDVIIGWVKDGQVHFADRHAEGHSLPAKDASQDWTLLMGQEVSEFTSLKMSRKLETCDDQDRPILPGTTRVIFSYNPTDPASDDAISYHGSTRGTKSLLLLDPPTNEQQGDSLPSDVRALEYRMKNFSVPSTDTTYWCTLWKLPDLGGKHHMIRYEPIIQKGHENLLHHILLYYCTGDLGLSSPDESTFNCYHNPVRQSHQCYSIFVAWAIGGKTYSYPKHTGYSMGGNGDPGYFMMETHYDNPRMRRDYVDSSGLRLYLTSQLRQYDAGVLSTGVHVDTNQIIPPYEQSFLSQGYCGTSCMDEGLGDQEIHVFANLLHAHLIGVKLRTRHFRNGTELAPIQEDNNYDFDYQEMRALEKERTIKKGDSLLVECEYDSTKRTEITFGGLSSREEMCLSFLVYYPKMKLDACESRLVYEIPDEYAGQSPESIVKHLDWSRPASHNGFYQAVQHSKVTQLCHGSGTHFKANYRTFDLPAITKPYKKPSTCPVA